MAENEDLKNKSKSASAPYRNAVAAKVKPGPKGKSVAVGSAAKPAPVMPGLPEPVGKVAAPAATPAIEKLVESQKVVPAKVAPAAMKPAANAPAPAKAAPVEKVSPKSAAPQVVPAPRKPAPAPVLKPEQIKVSPPAETSVAPATKAPVPASAEPAPEATSAPLAQENVSSVEAAAPEAISQAAASEKPAATGPVFAGLFSNFMLEETNMDMSTNFTGFQSAMTDAQAKAKAAFEKGTSVMGEVTEFAKGNVEAVVESGKIFAEGMQGIGSELVSESRSAFETMTGDIKELAAAKSPTDFFKIQSDLVRKNFDTAVAYGSKNSEAMLKLFSDSIAPISGRVSVAVSKARSTAPATF